jgi:hypothetical protein
MNFIKYILVSLFILSISIAGSATDYPKVPAVLFESLNCKTFLQTATTDSGFLENEDNTLSDSLLQEVEKANYLADYVTKEQRIINKLDSSTMMVYPVGLVSQGGDLNYAIILDQDEVNKNGSLLNAYMSFKVPQSSDSLAFVAKNIPLSTNGGISGDVKLDLINTATIPLGQYIRLKILGGEGKSFVIFGCDGFKSMQISAEVEFSQSVFLCENPSTGEIIPNKQLTSSFSITINDWNDLMVQLSIDPFQIKGIDGFGFDIKKVILDLSDLNNPAGVNFPAGYLSTYFPGENPNLWRGFYIQEATVRFPSEFSKKTQSSSNDTSSQRTALTAYNMLIDNIGFSGTIAADNLLTLDEGDMNGWGFSIDKFNLTIEANSLKEAGFSGELSVPLLDSVLLYTALIGMDGNYDFTATTTSKNSFNLWAADLDLYPNSTIEIKSENGNFLPKANLNGKLTINASLSGDGKETDNSKSVSLADITFENLQIQTVAPYIIAGTFSFGSEEASQTMAGFPVSIQNIGASINGDEAALNFDIIVNLVGEDDGGFGATGGFVITGERQVINGSSHWKYKSTDINDISINLACGPLKMNGGLVFYKNDAVFGNGFQGNIDATFGLNIEVQAGAMFGKIRNNRYWYADALASIGSGITIFSGIAIYGFGGGAYFHMKQGGTTAVSGNLGKSSSGIIYVPDSTVYLGLKASVVIGTQPSKEPFNGDAGFEIAFNNNMGVKYIAFTGNGYFMTPPMPDATQTLTQGCKNISGGGNGASNQDTSSPKGQIYASVYISYDFDNDVLHGDLKVYVNVAGILKGVNANNLAGEAVLHFEKSNWYIYIGTPDQPVGITLLGMLNTQSYFMVGTEILPSPPPPQNVSSILGNIDLDYMKDLNSLGKGEGIAFGSRFTMNTGDLTFLMFYANFDAGFGYDVMLKNYGNATCAGSSSPIGINGWYANGQIFGYLEGKIGINVKIFGIHKKADILSIGAAAILQAKLPNPTWMHGAVGGYFSVFGGLVSGSCNFEFTIGEECQIVGGSVLNNINVIAKVTPDNGTKDISVFNKPQAVFNYQINKQFDMVDLDNTKKTYRIKLDYFKITDGSNEIIGSQEWNGDNTVLAIKPTDILPGQKTLKASIQVSFEELENGSWQSVYDNGKQITESLETEFQTGAAPDYIPLDNVSYSYPVINQMNYYKDESGMGYIKLNQGQDYLFNVSSEWIQKGRFVSVQSGQNYYFNFSYDFTNNEVSFTRPEGLPNDEIMKFELVNLPAAAAKAIDANVDTVVTKVNQTSQGNDLSLSTKNAEGSIKELTEKSIYTSYFKTSKYNSFSQKLSASQNMAGWAWPIRTNVEVLYVTLNVNETFDKFEIYGLTNDPLIKMQADLSSNDWYNNIMYPVVYKNYTITPILTVSDTMGIPPVNALYVYQYNDSKILTDDEISNGQAQAISQYTSFAYNLPNYIDNDLYELKNKIANSYLGKCTQRMIAVLNGKMILLSAGVYKINASYYLPGKKIKTSTVPMNINFLL